MIGLEVTVRCPFHDAPVEIVAVGDPEGDMSVSTVRCLECRSVFQVAAVMTAQTVRFGFNELEDWIHRMRGLPIHNTEGCICGPNTALSCVSAPTIAHLCGVGVDTATSWKRRGLSERKADEAATALGVHPSEVWPEAWRVLTEADLLGELEEA